MSFWSLATVDLAPLRRHRDFRLLFLGRAVTRFGSMITFVAIPFQTYQLTRSSLIVGLVGAAELVPLLGFALWGGALADAADRRRLVLRSEAGLTIISGLFAVNAWLPRPQLWAIFALAAAAAAFEAVQRPALDAMLPRLVDQSELAAAGALSNLQGTLGKVLGPAAAGILIAGLGLPVAYLVDVLTFLGSLLGLALMRQMPPPEGAEPPSLRRIVEGLRYARGRPELIGTYLVDIIAMAFGMPFALMPAFAGLLGGGVSTLGLLYSAPALGSMVAGATSGWTSRVNRQGAAVILAATAWGLAVTGFGLASSLPVAMLMMALAGGADAISGIFRQVIWNQTIPDHLRGRLAAIELLSYSTGPLLGDIESGVVAAASNVRISAVSGGLASAVLGLVCALLLPTFWSYDRRRPPSGSEPSQPRPEFPA